MKSMNKVVVIALSSFLATPLWAQDVVKELNQLQQNYVQSLISGDERTSSLIDLLSGIQPETEISDQVVAELHQRYPFNIERIKVYLETLREDGSWADINYNDPKRSGWDAKVHPDRVLELAKLYKSEKGDCHWGPKLEEAIHRAMGYWFRTKPVCKNWWYNEIGIPKTFGPAFLLFADRLTPAEKQSAVEVMQQARFGMTGQNKVWLAGNVLMRGLLQQDYNLVKAARDTIVSEIMTGGAEGIKSDWSFHQHGPQQQFGNYGMAFLSEMANFAGLFAGTTFALSREHQDILNTFLLDGYRWIVWRGYLDVNCLDRQLFHSGQLHKGFSVAFAANALEKGSAKEDVQQIDNWLHDNYAPDTKGSRFTGHKHFWDSDQTIHRSPSWVASVKMASDRVIGTELVNEDNLKGFYMGDGALYTYCRGDEYLNVFPFWDWRKIPGITSYESDEPVPTATQYGEHVRNNTSFVGGVTDGKTGMTSMILDRDRLYARKSWVFTDDFVLCLGAGIQSDSTLAITTSIDQRVKQGDLFCFFNNNWMKVEGKKALSSAVQRFHHDNTGYVLLQPENSVAISEKRSGRWCDFMGSYAPKVVEGEVVSLYIQHNPKVAATYQYVILPASTAKETSEFSSDRIQMIRNDEAAQAVVVDKCLYLTVYTPDCGRISIPKERMQSEAELQLEVHTPGIYMIRQDKGKITIEASDPTHQQKALSLSVNGQEVKIVLLATHNPGESIAVTPFISAPQVTGIRIDGNKDDWKIEPLLTGLIAPWDGAVKDNSSFYAGHDQKYFYFLYEVSDSTLTYNAEKTEASVGNEDRVEFFISCDPEMNTYYCAEMDPQGKVMDYEARHYRKFDMKWDFKNLNLKTYIGKNTYRVEGSIPLKELKKMGVLSPSGELRMGVYRADYKDAQGKNVVWSSWIIPDAAQPDFHIPSSLGILKLE